MSKLVALIAVMALASPVRADPGDVVGLYRLDTDKKLEIYGQAIANEIARTLKEGGLDVVVVGEHENTPDRVKLVVGGKIESKGATVVLSLTVRDIVHGVTTDELTTTAPTITKLEKAAAEISDRLISTIKGRLATLHTTFAPLPPIADTKPPPPKPKAALFAVVASGAPGDEPLRQALGDALAPWTQHHGREPRLVDPKSLTRDLAAKTIAASNTDLGVLFEIAELTVEPGEIPMARARVHVLIADAQTVLFDRTVVTDTVVGDKGMAPPALAARAARAVLAIIAPAIHRKVSGWRAGD